MTALRGLLTSGEGNDGVGWVLVGALVLSLFEDVLDGDLLWAVLTAVTCALLLLPPVRYRDRSLLPPRELLVLVVLPFVSRALLGSGLVTQLATYLSIAAVALVVVVELVLFTSLDMTDGFAVAFVVMTTMAAAGAWAIAQWVSDAYLGTTFLRGPTELMWDLVAATAVGALAGGLFRAYFNREEFVRERGIVPEGDA